MASDELKPGQKFPTPTPGVGDRVFYETLYRQRPDSLMAQEWCVSYGVLPHKEAEKVYQILTQRKKNIRLGGGSSSPVPPTVASGSSNNKKKKARLVKDEGVDPDMMISGEERIGSGMI